MKLKYRQTPVYLAGVLLLALVATWPVRADYQTTVVSQSPAGYWRLNGTVQPPTPPIYATNSGSYGALGNGEYIDAVRGITPGAIFSEPNSGSVLFQANVDGNRVRIPYNPQWDPAGPFSVEFWAKPGQTESLQCPAASVNFVTAREGWLFYQGDTTLSTGNGFIFRHYNDTGPSALSGAAVNVSIDTAKWYHVVGVYDGTTIKIYVNGALGQSTTFTGSPRVNTGVPLTFGARGEGLAGFWTYNGMVDEAAIYSTALSDAQILAHYQAGTNPSPATAYRQVILSDNPVGYWRFNEPGDPITPNLGSLGSAADAKLFVGTTAGIAGPRPTTFPGFEAGNNAVSFNGAGGVVQIPALNLNTNTVTLTAWIKANGAQASGAGLVVHGSDANASGLTIDPIYGGLGLGYIWNGEDYGISLTDFSFSPLPDNQWAFAALVIEPFQVSFYTCDANNAANFVSLAITNSPDFSIIHANQAFASATSVGAAPGTSPVYFNGTIDEPAIFKRALSAGEVYTEYAAAVGGLAPRIFADLAGPADPVAVGDPLVLKIDAGGTPDLTYAWSKNGAPVGTTATGVFTVPSAVHGDAGNYAVTISNGSGSVQSATVTVATVTPSIPTIVELQGYLNRTLYPTGTLSMAVVATGGGLKYQWYRNATPIASATSSAYQIDRIADNTVAGNYSVSVTNSVGSATSGPPAVITIPTVPTDSYEAAVIASGPEAWWRLDESGGSTYLFDGMGRHDGTYTNLSGAVPPVMLGVPGALVGNTNTGASFSGNQGIGIIPYSPAFSQAKFTIEGWVRTTVTDDPNLCPFSSVYGDSGHYWRTSPAGEWSPYGGSARAPLLDNGQTNAVVVYNQWTHLVMCYDSSIAGFPWIYAINGVRATTSWSGTGPNQQGPIIIGAAGVGPAALAQYFWKGQVDEVAIYPRVLSNAEILAHYTARGEEVLPPTFSTPFLSQTVTAGKTVSFNTTVFGTAPISLQWYKGTDPLTGATSASLTLANVSSADIGTYTLWATNAAGTASQNATLNVIAATAYANVTNDLVLHLRFDGNATDSSGRGNNGTPMGSPGFVTGLIGPQALEYTTVTAGDPAYVSSASYVDLGKPTDLQFGSTASFSIGLWVKLASGFDGGDLPFIGIATNSMNNPGWALSPTYGGGGWQWCLNDGVNNIDVNGADGTINDGSWHNFVLTVDRTAKVASAYLDGVCVNKTDITSLGNVDNNNYWPVTIGQDPTGLYPEAGSAILDDLGIWKRALTALEVTQIASAGSTAGRSFDTVNPNPDVIVTIGKSGSNLTLSWSQGTLQQSDSLGATAAWTTVPGAVAPSHTVTPGTGNKFYRVLVSP